MERVPTDEPKDSVEALTRDLGINAGGLVVGGAKRRTELMPNTAYEIAAELSAPDILAAVHKIEQAAKTRAS
jgi:hypothetical protein